MTPTQLFRAALTLDRTQQSFATLDRHATIDRNGALRMFRRNIRDADTDKTCDDSTRYKATDLLLTYYMDRRMERESSNT